MYKNTIWFIKILKSIEKKIKSYIIKLIAKVRKLSGR